jgi:hypothetical protein
MPATIGHFNSGGSLRVPRSADAGIARTALWRSIPSAA